VVAAASAASSSHAQFVSQADAICAKAVATAKANAKPDATTTKELAATLGKDILILRPEIKATLALPARVRPAAYHRSDERLTQELALLQKAENAAAANNQPTTLADLTKASALHATANTLAKKLGLKVCGT
jgi:hypothetical protein